VASKPTASKAEGEAQSRVESRAESRAQGAVESRAQGSVQSRAENRVQSKPQSKMQSMAPDSRSVRALVLGGYGLNCDLETEYAFHCAGARADRVHINDLVGGRVALRDYHILALIGGFAWADDHGAGVILATKLRHHLGDAILEFVAAGSFVIGICNGFQALANLGLLPGFTPGTFRREVALTYNDCGNFRNQWVHLKIEESPCVLTAGLSALDLPIRHGEGKFIAGPDVLARLQAGRQIVMRYAKTNGEPAQGAFPWNPNGSLEDIAGICDPSGRIFGLMPHPEAFNHPTNHPDWSRRKWTASRRATARARQGAARGAPQGSLGSAQQVGGVVGQDGITLFRNVVEAAKRI